MIQQMLAIWSLIPLPFLNPALTSGNSQFTYCWSLAWRILSITLLACDMSAIEHSLALHFFGIGMKTDLFQSCGHCWVFQICWHIQWGTFIASSFMIWNHRQLANLITWTTALSNSVKLCNAMWGHPRQMGHNGEVWQNVVHWRREWQTTSVFLPWEPHEQYEKAKR